MVRTRLAPSPTGWLHIGTARTALFNYLFAKRNGGEFVLRVEDTDTERSKKEFEDDMLEGLRWLGILWDEGPDIGGPYGPYRQSERMELYSGYMKKLWEQNDIYRCYCTKEELERERELQTLAKQPPKYTGKCRLLSPDTLKAFEEEGRPSTLRFRVAPQIIEVVDLIRGKLTFDTAIMDDFIIAKDFNTPLYNFAVVVDDFLMKITHVIRGEEHISNIPKQVILDYALGFDVPTFAHLSLILNPDRSKLSKRQNKVSLLEYRQEGFLPKAIVNFIAFLGWNPGGENEIFSLEEMVKLFDIENVNKSGAIFNIPKLEWYNNHYIRSTDLSEITKQCIRFYADSHILHMGSKEGEFIADEGGETVDFDMLMRIVNLERERVKRLSEIPQNTRYFFQKRLSVPRDMLKWKSMTSDDVEGALHFAHSILSGIPENSFDPQTIEQALKGAIKESGKENGAILWPLRVALTGLEKSPNPFDIASILGKEQTLQRIAAAFR